MLLRYNGIPWTQEDVVRALYDAPLDSTMTNEDLLRINGFHPSFTNGSSAWEAECSEFPGPFAGPIAVRLIDQRRFVIIGLSEQHLALVHRVSYRFIGGDYKAEDITIFDPYTNRSSVLKWADLQPRVSRFWECYVLPATRWRS
jgi:hypothetical protein